MIVLSLAICVLHLVLCGMSLADQHWISAVSQLNVATWAGLAARLQYKLNKHEQ
jgi:hypothetical protein